MFYVWSLCCEWVFALVFFRFRETLSLRVKDAIFQSISVTLRLSSTKTGIEQKVVLTDILLVFSRVFHKSPLNTGCFRFLIARLFDGCASSLSFWGLTVCRWPPTPLDGLRLLNCPDRAWPWQIFRCTVGGVRSAQRVLRVWFLWTIGIALILGLALSAWYYYSQMYVKFTVWL